MAGVPSIRTFSQLRFRDILASKKLKPDHFSLVISHFSFVIDSETCAEPFALSCDDK